MGIRRLTACDHEVVFAFVKKEASKNLFIIGDIEAYGYEQEFQELWGDFHDQALRGILLGYYDAFVAYGVTGYDAKGFSKLIASYEHVAVSGDADVLDELAPFLNLEQYKKTDTFFAECKKSSVNLLGVAESEVKLATVADASRLAELTGLIEEFTGQPSVEESTKRLQKKFESKAGRTYYIEEKGKVLSMVSTTAENSQSAMIVGVCTRVGYRNRGYVTTILNYGLPKLLEEKQVLCLFYDNPAAGSIYKRSGFYDIGSWRMYKKVI